MTPMQTMTVKQALVTLIAATAGKRPGVTMTISGVDGADHFELWWGDGRADVTVNSFGADCGCVEVVQVGAAADAFVKHYGLE